MAKGYKTTMIAWPYMTGLSAAEVKRVDEAVEKMRRRMLRDLGIEEEGAAGRGPELPAPSSELLHLDLEVQSVLRTTIQSGGCQADYHACDYHHVPLLEAGDDSAQLYPRSEENPEAEGD